MSFLTGKKESKNLAYPWMQQAFGGQTQELFNQGQAGLTNVTNILNGTDNGAGYETYKKSTGYQDIFDESMRGVSSNAAARGLLASGSTVRGLADRGGQLAQQNFGNYLQQLLGTANASFGAGGTLLGNITNAGQYSKEREGLLTAIGNAAQGIGAAAASDPRLKDDIELLEREPDGLGIYSYRYKWDDPDSPARIGVMADEVADLRPHALGPELDGFKTVVYEAL